MRYTYNKPSNEEISEEVVPELMAFSALQFFKRIPCQYHQFRMNIVDFGVTVLNMLLLGGVSYVHL